MSTLARTGNSVVTASTWFIRRTDATRIAARGGGKLFHRSALTHTHIAGFTMTPRAEERTLQSRNRVSGGWELSVGMIELAA